MVIHSPSCIFVSLRGKIVDTLYIVYSTYKTTRRGAKCLSFVFESLGVLASPLCNSYSVDTLNILRKIALDIEFSVTQFLS